VTARRDTLTVPTRRKPPRPVDRSLLARYHAAVKITAKLGEDERLDLLAAVVWPRELQLRAWAA
jgi:hypothetical protein